jgi:hypothetical protein
MRNLLLATALLSTLAFPAMAAQECHSPQAVIESVAKDSEGVTFAIYEGQEAQSIQDGMAQMGAKLEGPRVFVVFQNGTGVDLLVGFKDGCYEGSAQVPHRFIDAWLAGFES